MKSFVRYPGGKSKNVAKILRYFRDEETDFREPFVGGGSVFLAAEFESAWINDINPGVYDMWWLVKHSPNVLVDLIEKHTPILVHQRDPDRILESVDLWRSVKDDVDYQKYPAGYRTYFLTRTCFSGVPTGGIMGGAKQTGKYLVYSRWAANRSIQRICLAHRLLKHTRITNMAYEDVINSQGTDASLYLDPPYLKKGGQCYEYAFTFEDHQRFAEIVSQCNHRFVVTVDDCDEIVEIWKQAGVSDKQMIHESWSYSMTDFRKSNRVGKELFIVDKNTARRYASNT